MQTPATALKLATLLVLAASTALPALSQASGMTSTVVYAGGDDLVIKASDGKLLNFSVPRGTMFATGGKQVPLSELKPGAKLTAPVSTGSDGMIVTSVDVAKGKVFAVNPPDGVTLSLAEGAKELTIPAGTTFMVDGKKLSASDLKVGMMVEATIVTIAPDGASAGSAPAPSGALLVAHAAGSAEDLPAAGTNLPLFGILGASLLAFGLVLLNFRKPVNQL
jgi:hypothetical protein